LLQVIRPGPPAGAPGPRPIPEKADDQGPPRRRRAGSAAVDRAHPGQVNDATAFRRVLDGSRFPRAATGRPRTAPDRILGDKAYSSRALRHLLRRRGIATTIPERRDRAANRRRRGALGDRPPAFDTAAYRDRNVVERCFARLKQFRAIATRFGILADRYHA
jgi:transposase